MIVDPKALWPNGSTINVAFIDPPAPGIKQKIIAIASEWLAHVNLKFNFVDGPVGDIRIKVDPNESGGQSNIGTDNQDTPETEPTMSLGLSEQTSDLEFRTTVLHEFGHMLGAHHEHQHPDANIPWDREQLFAFLTAQEGVTEEIANAIIDTQFSPMNDLGGFVSNGYDRDSIMHYDVHNYSTIGDVELINNGELSPKDIELMKRLYPQPRSSSRGEGKVPGG